MAKFCMVASLMTCHNLMIILVRFWSGHHGQILMVASLMTCQNLIVILARFWAGHHGQILHGSITNDLSEPYDNLGKILVRSPWPNLDGSITNDLSEPYGNLGKILWPNRTFKTSHELDKILVQFSSLSPDLWTCHNLAIIFERLWSDHFGQILAWWNLFRPDKIFPCFLARLYLDQILSGTLEELGVNFGKILANQNLARQPWHFIQDTCKKLGNIFSMVVLINAHRIMKHVWWTKITWMVSSSLVQKQYLLLLLLVLSSVIQNIFFIATTLLKKQKIQLWLQNNQLPADSSCSQEFVSYVYVLFQGVRVLKHLLWVLVKKKAVMLYLVHYKNVTNRRQWETLILTITLRGKKENW